MAATETEAPPDAIVHTSSGIMIAAGMVSGCAALEDGVKCWGAKGWPATTPKAVTVPGMGKLVALSTGPQSTWKSDRYCGALADQGLTCWTVDGAGIASAAPPISLPVGIKNISVATEHGVP